MDEKLTTRQKIRALVESGLAENAREAREMLVDMGEIDE